MAKATNSGGFKEANSVKKDVGLIANFGETKK